MAIPGTTNSDLSVRYFMPPAYLKRYVQAVFLMETYLPQGCFLSDIAMPTWGVVNWRDRAVSTIKMRSGEAIKLGLGGIAGPFDHAVGLEVGQMRQWTAILLPAGWSRFVKAPAREYANRAVSIDSDDAFAAFQQIGEKLFSGMPDREAELQIIFDELTAYVNGRPREDEDRIDAILAALVDDETANVADLADRAGVGRKTLERVCNSAFGLPPKMLLRRQRFVRSVTQHMLQGDRPWTEAIDDIYHDQPQFVREFREFTGMSPREFAQLDRPMLKPALLEGMRHWQRQGEFVTDF